MIHPRLSATRSSVGSRSRGTSACSGVAVQTVELDSVHAEPAPDSRARAWPGVGAQLLARLAKLDIHRPEDLLLHLPLRYEDETRLTPIAAARPGFSVQVEGEVSTCEIVLRPRRQLLVRVSDSSGTLIARWLNFYPSQQKQLAPGRRVRLFGEADTVLPIETWSIIPAQQEVLPSASLNAGTPKRITPGSNRSKRARHCPRR